MHKINPFFWFDHQAEDAMRVYKKSLRTWALVWVEFSLSSSDRIRVQFPDSPSTGAVGILPIDATRPRGYNRMA